MLGLGGNRLSGAFGIGPVRLLLEDDDAIMMDDDDVDWNGEKIVIL
jgi:hypothetical protein